ncbi:MAG: DUF512 domain-containing protein [Candidatus Limivicinus sp.]|nr:DUF512 domain-containing protein [Clostridiales bacterium]MDY6133505.1 DUF512 domain-containing protein [Candidatus Limivicinus sp.]
MKSMENIIKSIDRGSPLHRKAHVGDAVISINGNKIIDVLDYKFFAYDSRLKVLLRRPDGSEHEVTVHKSEGGDLGLEFESYLMDTPRSCANNCVFCFIDQLPGGMRRTMYFKDDDARLSFLLGNYITLTNLSKREIERIIALHISPINVSVHTTNPELRCKMLQNPRAGESIETMRRFAQAGIVMNCQIVCCPGLNDGEELLRSMRDLEEMYPGVHSVSIVPVGLTRFREGLYPLTPYTKELAGETIDMVTAFGDECLKRHGTRIFFCGDELYIKAERELPPDEFYEEHTQLENGVGMIRLLETEFRSALMLSDEPDGVPFSIATGVSAAPYFEKLLGMAKEKYGTIKGQVYAIENDFFGRSINVTGLITGQDLIKQLKGRALGERLLISQNMLRREEMDFLDDVTLEQASKELGVPIYPIEQDGFALWDAMAGELPEIRLPVRTEPTEEYYKYNQN